METLIENGRPVFQKVVGTEFELECELVLLAMGFAGTDAGAQWPSSGWK